MNKKTIINILKGSFLMVLIMATLSGCQYDFIEFDEPNLDEPVSFSLDILPIFTSGNNCTSCHGAGGTSPELTAQRAYSSIVPALINTDNPASSRIYVFPNPSSSSHSFKKYTHAQAGLILAWITQGAENN